MLLSNIKKLCQDHRITLAHLERETGLSNGAIAKWGTSSPTIGNVKSVADYFGVLVDDLLSAEGVIEDVQGD